MNRHVPAIVILSLVVAACASGQAPSTGTAEPSPEAQATSAPSITPSSSPTAQPTASFLSVLQGTWTTPPTTCDQQNAALAKAGFTSDQLKDGGWETSTCNDMGHGSQFTIRFADDKLVIFQDGVVGWGGKTQGVDNSTFTAGEHGAQYLRYRFAIDGDTLTVDMLEDAYPTSSEAERLGDAIAQTIVYETSPFTREGAESMLEFDSALYPYHLSMPAGWDALPMEAGADEDHLELDGGDTTLTVGSGGRVDPSVTVENRIAINRAEEFPGCETDPTKDEVTAIGRDFDRAIRWTFACGPIQGVAVNTIRNGTSFRLTLRSHVVEPVALARLMDTVLVGFTFTD
jgi:hypothetical protein